MNINTLRLLRLPVFSDIGFLSLVLFIPKYKINRLVWRNSNFYRKVDIPKKTRGEYRTILQPNREVKAIQSWILRHILDKLPVSHSAKAYRKRVSIIDNCRPHIENRYFLTIDLVDFFNSIKFEKVYTFFKGLGYSKEVSWALSRLCTCNGHLPQGGVTSPALSNLIFSFVDRRIEGLCFKNNITYTRYADDLTFSARNPQILQNVKYKIIKILESEGYSINNKKLRFSGPRRRTTITGIVKNSSSPSFDLGRIKKREMRAIMHGTLRGGCSRTIGHKIRTIEGWLSYLKSINDNSYTVMQRYWTKICEKSVR